MNGKSMMMKAISETTRGAQPRHAAVRRGTWRALATMLFASALMGTSLSSHAQVQGLPSGTSASKLPLGGGKILPVEEAFKLEVADVKRGRIELIVTAAPGTYLYRDKFKFALSPKALKLAAPQFPVGVMRDDETFGHVMTYSGAQSIELPYSGAVSAKSPGALTVEFQGCNEIAKICYPPHTVTLPLAMIPSAEAINSDQNRPSSVKSDLKSPKNGIVLGSTVDSVPKMDAAIKAAAGKHVMIDVWATWCAPCKAMEKAVFADPEVKALLAEKFVVIKADVTKSGSTSAAILKRYDLVGPPGFAFYGKNGKELLDKRLNGQMSKEDFLKHLQSVAAL